jgi:hypothetical protein
VYCDIDLLTTKFVCGGITKNTNHLADPELGVLHVCASDDHATSPYRGASLLANRSPVRR